MHPGFWRKAMATVLIPLLCLWYLTALLWWTLPYSLGNDLFTGDAASISESRMVSALRLDQAPWLQAALSATIDATGSQQYWDFFAPRSPRFHQYLSVCRPADAQPDPETIACDGAPRFSNFQPDFAQFKAVGRDQSRWYRLTETLIYHRDPKLLAAFTRYYAADAATVLISHQFELRPELPGLVHSGYRTDQRLWTQP
jgi:hypothetical protein